MTKTWFDGGKIVTQEIPEEKIYWQGLTDEEVGALQDFAYADDAEFIRHIEAKLKDKNGG
jgi:hypothetical protein